MKTIYKAEDGTEFSEMQDCMDHDVAVRKKAIIDSGEKLYKIVCHSMFRCSGYRSQDKVYHYDIKSFSLVKEMFEELQIHDPESEEINAISLMDLYETHVFKSYADDTTIKNYIIRVR